MQKSKEFIYDGKWHRIVGRTVRTPVRGYTSPDVERYNVVQVKVSNIFTRLFNIPIWRDVETEFVPDHVVISVGSFGHAGGWQSELYKKYSIT